MLQSKIIFGFLFFIFNSSVFAQQTFEGERWTLIKNKKTDSNCPFYEISFGKDDYCISITSDSLQCGRYKVNGECLQIMNVLDGCDFFNPKDKFNYRFIKKKNDIVILKPNKLFSRKRKMYQIDRS